MENELVFRILTAVLLVGFSFHRGLQTKRRKPENQRIEKELSTASLQDIVNILSLIALASSLIYIALPNWINWAGLPLPSWLRLCGVLISAAGFALLESAQAALDKNWSDQPVKLKDHTLTQGGPYRWIRHPIYTGFLLILSAPLFLSANWIVGFSWIAATYFDVTRRIRIEEVMLAETFGNEFQSYVNSTGRLFPRPFARRS